MAAATFLILSLACEKSVDYSYFEVTVMLDRATIEPDMLIRFNSCEVEVQGPHEDAADLRCIPGTVKYDFGTFGYSTSAPKGSVKFIVTARDLHQEVIARGESQPRGIVPNAIQTLTILVKGVTPPDGGAPGPTPDAGADATPDASGPADGSDAPRDGGSSDSG